jgi:hypothetical protein
MDYGEVYDNAGLRIHLRAPPALNKTLNLSTDEWFNDTRQGLAVLCKPTKDDFISFCERMNVTQTATVWSLLNISGEADASCKAVAPVCLDNITAQCTMQEKLNGTSGFASCWNRNLDAMQKNCQVQEDEANKWHSAYNSLNDSFTVGKQTVQGNNDFAESFVGASLLVVGLGLTAIIYIDKKNKERRPS